MNKNSGRKKDKIVPFPNLEQRLLNKGMEALKERQYKEALNALTQLINQYPGRYSEAEIGIVVCLLELGYYDDAKEKCARLLQQDVGDYFNVLQIYLTILMQQSAFAEVVAILETLFEEEKIPPAYAENLFQLLEFSRRSIESGNIIQKESSIDLNKLQQQLLNGTKDEQLQVIQILRKETDVIKIIDTIKTVLKDEKTHPIIKSMLLHLMIEKEIHDSFTVHKFGNTITVHSKEIKLHEDSLTNAVLKIIDEQIGQENPSLSMHMKELWKRILFTLFPFPLEPKQPSIWAASLHKYGNELFGMEISDLELIEMYNVKIEEVQAALKKLEEVEKCTEWE